MYSCYGGSDIYACYIYGLAFIIYIVLLYIIYGQDFSILDMNEEVLYYEEKNIANDGIRSSIKVF